MDDMIHGIPLTAVQALGKIKLDQYQNPTWNLNSTENGLYLSIFWPEKSISTTPKSNLSIKQEQPEITADSTYNSNASSPNSSKSSPKPNNTLPLSPLPINLNSTAAIFTALQNSIQNNTFKLPHSPKPEFNFADSLKLLSQTKTESFSAARALQNIAKNQSHKKTSLKVVKTPINTAKLRKIAKNNRSISTKISVKPRKVEEKPLLKNISRLVKLLKH